MSVQHADGGDPLDIYIRYDSKTSGKDIESYITETVNTLLQDLFESEASISESLVLNPGFTIKGKASNTIFNSEMLDGKVYTNMQRVFNGWKIKKDKMLSKLKKINKELGFNLFNPLEVRNTDAVLLYQIKYQLAIAPEGIDKIETLTKNKIISLADRYVKGKVTQEDFDRIARRINYRLSTVSYTHLTLPTICSV